MTNIYITGGEGLIGQDCTIKAKDLPEKLPKGSRIQARPELLPLLVSRCGP